MFYIIIILILNLVFQNLSLNLIINKINILYIKQQLNFIEFIQKYIDYLKLIFKLNNNTEILINKLNYLKKIKNKLKIYFLSIKKKNTYFFKENLYINHQTKFITKNSVNKFNISQYKNLIKLNINLINQKFKTLKYYLNKFKKLQLIKVTKTKKIVLFNINNVIFNYIIEQIKINYELFIILNKQIKSINFIKVKQYQVFSQILKIQKKLSIINNQLKWLNYSPILGEILQFQLSKLPIIIEIRKINQDIFKLKYKRLIIKKILHNICVLNFKNLTTKQNIIFNIQINLQFNLLNSLLSNYDLHIQELIKLKIDNNQLKNLIQDIKNISHLYLLWIPDSDSINFNFFFSLILNIRNLLKLKIFSQLIKSIIFIFNNIDRLILLLFSLILIWLKLRLYRHYYTFLNISSDKISRVGKDNFYLTTQNIFWSILMASPIPIFFLILGYQLCSMEIYPNSIIIGDSILYIIPMLWIAKIYFYFSKSNGLFIVHFGWKKQKVKLLLQNYLLIIRFLIPLISSYIFLNQLNLELTKNIIKLCFLTICIFLFLIKYNFKKAELFASTNNLINFIGQLFWSVITFIPILAFFLIFLGYLYVTKIILIKLEYSIFICVILFFIYCLIIRWINIKHKLIAFIYIKQRYSELLFNEKLVLSNEEQYLSKTQLSKIIGEINLINFQNANKKTLKLTRSILITITLLMLILFWSKLSLILGFLKNIILWDTNSIDQDTGNIKSITLETIFITIIICTITGKMVSNLPELLKSSILKYLDLSPSNNYTIISITKYGLILLGIIIILFLLEIDWYKLQWLIAALGVGLGFGLQEIFTNFISGLIILFEKPIRVGDTVTINHLTGSISKINIRATTIIDWDKKELIVPNKYFITAYFINWSLSDTITRIVINVPAPINVDVNKITNILIQAANCCSLVLKNPSPEAFLIDLQNGIPLFELRLYVAQIKYRMLIRHQIHEQIINIYKENGIELPFPPFQIKNNQIDISNLSKKKYFF